MATGKPRSSERKNTANYELTYSNKKAREVILSGSPANLEELFHIETCNTATWRNRLYWSDNYAAMLALLSDDSVRGKVRLVYIDPPFSTRSTFESRSLDHAYHDSLTGTDFLEFLRERLVVLHELLAEDGSIYLHLDGNMAFEIKIIMDEIFGTKNFRNWITRKKCNRKNYTRRTYGNVADYILFYTKSDNYVWHRVYEPWTEEAIKREYPCVDPITGKRYKKVPIHAPGVRNGETGKEWRGMMPPKGKHWQYIPEKLDEFDAMGQIYWSPNGNPRRKIYAESSEGIPAQDIWLEFRDAHNQNILITGYPTEKNAFMIDRIIEASSNEGDIVMDCFSGSGTTLERSERLGRRWIGIDNGFEAIKTTLERFSNGTKRMGDFVSERLTRNEFTLFPELQTVKTPSIPLVLKANFALFHSRECIEPDQINLIETFKNDLYRSISDPIQPASNTA